MHYVASDGVKRTTSSSQYKTLTQRKETQSLVSYYEPALIFILRVLMKLKNYNHYFFFYFSLKSEVTVGKEK